jgi:predicted ester cyclase
MSLKENKAIIRRLIEEVWSKEDLDALAEIMSVDCILHDSEENGLETYKRGVVDNHAAWPDWQFTIMDIIAEGDKVVSRTRGKGTQTGEWFGLPPTNKEAEWMVWTTIRIADGKIAEVWQIFTGFWLYVQLGTIPSWEEIVKQAQSKQA